MGPHATDEAEMEDTEETAPEEEEAQYDDTDSSDG
jgi:hypothetical protein